MRDQFVGHSHSPQFGLERHRVGHAGGQMNAAGDLVQLDAHRHPLEIRARRHFRHHPPAAPGRKQTLKVDFCIASFLQNVERISSCRQACAEVLALL